MWPYLVVCFAGGIALAALTTAVRLRRERVRLLSEARRAREQEQGALLGHLASGLAHEIRNPLSTLSMNLQLLREDWASPVSEREQRGVRKLDAILRETQRLEKILEDLLRFSAGHSLRLERLDVNAVIDELLDFYTPQAEKARIRLVRELGPSLPPVEADANLLRQAIHNLLLNAQQAMPEGGDVTIRTEAGARGVRIVVSDRGPGIPAENIERIFNLYFSTKPGGTGLGLPMAKKIVEEHRGTLEVASEAGRGSTFTITLPALDGRR